MVYNIFNGGYMNNYSTCNRHFTTQEAAAIRREYMAGRESIVSICRQLKADRRTIRDIVNRRRAYSSENDSEHTMYMNNQGRFLPHVEKARRRLMPNFIWDI